MQMKIPVDPGQRPGVIGAGMLWWFILASVPALVLSIPDAGQGIPGIPGAADTWPAWSIVLLHQLGLDPGAPGSWNAYWATGVFLAVRLFLAAAVSLAWASLFSQGRRLALDSGWVFHAWFFVLLAPAAVPLPLLVIGLSFGLVFGCLVFGGTGRYFVSPVLLAVVFLQVSYPDAVRIAWMPGSELAVLVAVACLAGASALILGGLVSWRMIVGGIAGMLVAALAFDSIPWHWQPALGVFAFALAFVATDPSTLPMTRTGCWVFGIFFGSGTVVIRMLNPEHPEATLFALLLAALLTPLIDHWASNQQANMVADTPGHAHEHS